MPNPFDDEVAIPETPADIEAMARENVRLKADLAEALTALRWLDRPPLAATRILDKHGLLDAVGKQYLTALEAQFGTPGVEDSPGAERPSETPQPPAPSVPETWAEDFVAAYRTVNNLADASVKLVRISVGRYLIEINGIEQDDCMYTRNVLIDLTAKLRKQIAGT